MDFEHVLVVGAGQMGGGIAQVVAGSGRRVSLLRPGPGAVERGLGAMRKSLGQLAEKGGADPDEVLGRVDAGRRARGRRPDDRGGRRGSGSKEEVFRAADATLPAEAVLASNTSSIPISSLAAVTGRPDRVIGMHFFNPVPVMGLVEVVRGRDDVRRDGGGDRRARGGARQDAGRGARLPGLRLEPDPDAVHQRGGLGAARAASPRRRRSTRSRSSASPIRWGRSRSPT